MCVPLPAIISFVLLVKLRKLSRFPAFEDRGLYASILMPFVIWSIYVLATNRIKFNRAAVYLLFSAVVYAGAVGALASGLFYPLVGPPVNAIAAILVLHLLNQTCERVHLRFFFVGFAVAIVWFASIPCSVLLYPYFDYNEILMLTVAFWQLSTAAFIEWIFRSQFGIFVRSSIPLEIAPES